MNANHFDTWAHNHARLANRRTILGWSLSASLAAAISRVHPSAAQFSGPGGSCTYDITLTSSTTAGATVSGALVIDIGSSGAIDTGSLTLEGQAAASAVGQVTGLAIDLLASLDDGTILFLTGASSSESTGCPDQLSGSLANANANQLGTWTAQLGQSSQSANPAQSAPPAAPAQPVPPTSTPTPTAAAAAATCDPPKMICGQNCCPAGADCLDSGACQCPDGTEECGIACFPSCADGHALDPVTCLCPTG